MSAKPQFYQKAAGSTDSAPKAPSARNPTLSFPRKRPQLYPKAIPKSCELKLPRTPHRLRTSHLPLILSTATHMIWPRKTKSTFTAQLDTEPRIIRYTRNSLHNRPKIPIFSRATSHEFPPPLLYPIEPRRPRR